MKQVMRRMDSTTSSSRPAPCSRRISWAKNHMIDPQEYYLRLARPQRRAHRAHLRDLRKELRKTNAMDFDDLLLETVRLLKVSGEARERYKRRYRYILVDEYQDTNRPQYELMKLLAGEHKTSARSATRTRASTRWRGADIRNILEFEKDFPEREDRCAWSRTTARRRDILEAASARGRATTCSARARSFGPSARAARRSATTKPRTARTRRSSSPTTSRNICAS